MSEIYLKYAKLFDEKLGKHREPSALERIFFTTIVNQERELEFRFKQKKEIKNYPTIHALMIRQSKEMIEESCRQLEKILADLTK